MKATKRPDQASDNVPTRSRGAQSERGHHSGILSLINSLSIYSLLLLDLCFASSPVRSRVSVDHIAAQFDISKINLRNYGKTLVNKKVLPLGWGVCFFVHIKICLFRETALETLSLRHTSHMIHNQMLTLRQNMKKTKTGSSVRTKWRITWRNVIYVWF